MLLSKSTLKKVVSQKIGKNILKEIVEYVKDNEMNLWGIKKGEDFMEIDVNLCIYKDIHNIGYLTFWKQIKDWYGNSHKSLCYNTKKIRKILKKWAISVQDIFDLETWNNRSKMVAKVKELKRVNLWMDSSDFALKGKHRSLTKNIDWSYKLSSIGKRFQCIFDAQGRCISIWGGYSPKIIDSQWVEINKDQLSKDFKGSCIIADGHYFASRNLVEGVRFITPVPETVKNVPEDVQQYFGITKKDKELNKKIRNLRARVENPFGQIKNKFRSLGGTFKEDEKQLDFLVHYAIAIHNKNVK
jgi:hypothetical protein